MSVNHEKIAEYVRKRKYVTVPALEKQFSLPYSVARKEIELLEEEDLIVFRRGIVYEVRKEEAEEEEPEKKSGSGESVSDILARITAERGRRRGSSPFAERRERVRETDVGELLARCFCLEADGSWSFPLPVSLPDGTPFRFRYVPDGPEGHRFLSDDGSVCAYLERTAIAEDKEKYLENRLLELNRSSSLMVVGTKVYVCVDRVDDEDDLMRYTLDFFRALWEFFLAQKME